MENTVPSEISALLHEVERALDLKLYYLAIAVTLSLPDICASLEFDPENPPRANRATYAAWADAYVKFKMISGDDLYYLRCGVVHFGNFQHKKSAFDRIIFIGENSNNMVHDVIITVPPDTMLGGLAAKEVRLAGRLLHMQVGKFCRTILDAVRRWSIQNADTPNVSRNLPNLVRYRPNGLPPLIVGGVPTIA